MADSIAHGVARHYSEGWRLVEGTSWEGPRGAGAARSHASSVRPLGRAGAPLPEVNARKSDQWRLEGHRRLVVGRASADIAWSPVRVRAQFWRNFWVSGPGAC